MNEMTVDARGQVCPKPLILTKQALKNLQKDQTLKVLIDNDTSKKNVERFLIDNGIHPAITSSSGVFTLIINGAPEQLIRPDAETFCEVSSEQSIRPHVILIKNDKMGNGPDELGTILIKAFVNTIKEVSPLPDAMVFYTNGVLLTIDESPVLGALHELEKKGIRMLVCGTCADYFQIKGRIRVGIISNMYTILETLTGAGRILVP